MHMADSLVSPLVGGIMLASSVAVMAYSLKKDDTSLNSKKIPLMGIMGAFVFAAQMINFSIPGTGSSGHIGGGLLLAIILGPYAGFITMACILIIQALFFADGGLLAYGCNVINLGFYTCFIAYPFIYKKLIKENSSIQKKVFASILAAVVGLQLGAFSVVLETLCSGKTELPFGTFVLLMQPIHLAIGLVEGIVTAAVVTFVSKTSPSILENNENSYSQKSVNKVIAVLAICVLVTGGFVSWFASSNPDGLEWSIEKITGTTELEADSAIYENMSTIQEKTAFMPDYGFKTQDTDANVDSKLFTNGGTSTAGIVGGVLTLVIASLIGFIISKVKKRKTV